MKKIFQNYSNKFLLFINKDSGGMDCKKYFFMLKYRYIAILKKYKIDYFDKIDHLIFSSDNIHLIDLFKRERGIHKFINFSNIKKKNNIKFTSIISICFFKYKNTKIEINPNDLKYNVFKASGKGGQHRNKKLSAVSLTHVPTNITVVSKSERCQLKNRKVALEMIKSKLLIFTQKINAENLFNKINNLENTIVKIYCFYNKSYIIDKINKITIRGKKNIEKYFNYS